MSSRRYLDMPRLDEKQIERVRQRITDGMSMKECAASMGFSVHTISRAVENMGGVRALREKVNGHLKK